MSFRLTISQFMVFAASLATIWCYEITSLDTCPSPQAQTLPSSFAVCISTVQVPLPASVSLLHVRYLPLAVVKNQGGGGDLRGLAFLPALEAVESALA